MISILLLTTSIAQGKDQISLVKNGTTKYSIVADSSQAFALQAAQVIQRYTLQSTGVQLSIHNDRNQHPAIILSQAGADNTYVPDAYSLAVKEGNLYITGHGRGLLYAAYRYVREIIAGRKWYSGEENTWIPSHTTLYIASDFQLHANPAFLYREAYFPTELDQEYLDWYGLHNLEELWGLWGHSFNKILPPKTYFGKHPEYYALYQGKRQPTQLCLSNPEVLAHTIAYFKEQIQENPHASYWSIAPNDDIGHCTCDLCQALDKADGGPQGSLIHFVNQVAAAFPNQKFSTLAYLETANAPSQTKVADNVYVILSNIDASHQQDLAHESSAAGFRRQVRDWKAKSQQIFVWDYLTQFTNYLSPFPIQGTLQKNLSYLQEQGVSGLFLQAGGASYSDMAELNAYVLAQLLWDPKQSEADLTQEFIKGYYGKAAPFIANYLKERRERLRSQNSELAIYGNPIDRRKDFLSPEAMDRYSSLLEQAAAAIEGNKRLENRIRRISLGLDYTYLQQARFYGPHQHGIFEQQDETWQARPSLVRKITQFIADAQQLGIDELAEGGPSLHAYHQEWKQILAKGVRINNTQGVKISSTYPFDSFLPANGLHSLIDSVPGYLDFSYNWLTWKEKPMEVSLQFPESRKIDSISLHFLQDARHWIFPPQEVSISISTDGIHFEQILKQSTEQLEEDYNVQKIAYSTQVNKKIRAIRVCAIPLVHLPNWRFHPRKKPLLACDEIWLE